MSGKEKTIYDVIKEFAGIPDETGGQAKFHLAFCIANLINAFFRNSSMETLKKIAEIETGEPTIEEMCLHMHMLAIAMATLEADAEMMLNCNGDVLSDDIESIGTVIGANLAQTLNDNSFLMER